MGRQIQLQQGSTTLDLNDTTYVFQAADGWRSERTMVSIRVLVEPSALADRDRLVGAVRQMLGAAVIYEERAAGDPVYIRSKTCDDLDTTAELGATWLRRRVRGGSVTVQPLTGTAAVPAAILVIQIETTDDPWQRDVPAPVMEVISGPTYLSAYGSGAIQTTGDVELYARRLIWTSATGLTVRVFWQYASAGTGQINFLRLSTNFRMYWASTTSKWLFYDDAGTKIGESAVKTYTAGEMLDIAFTLATSAAYLYVNGELMFTSGAAISWPATPDTYRVLMTTSAGTQVFWSFQIWPTIFSATVLADLTSNWGRPNSEMCYLVPPSDLKATNSIYKIYNAGGDVPGPVRLLFDTSGSTDYGRVRVAYRPRRVPYRILMECEDGTLGAATTANANAAASAGEQARFTPADTSWATRVTVAWLDDPNDVADSQGDYRLYLAGYDSAASVQVNQVRWRLVVAGVASDWSEELSFATVGERALLDLGTLSMPPGNWPAEAVAATTDIYSASYVTVEVQARNTTGSGGGTLDMDALYAAPAEAEGSVEATFDVSAADLLVDFASDPMAAILVADPRTFEFAGWATYLGDDIALVPIFGTCGTFFFFWLRDDAEEFYPNDTCDVWFRYAPRFLG